MPFYDYYCKNCDAEKEELHAMSEEPLVICDECGKQMSKKISIGHGGFKMTSDGTRRRDYGTRYGGKKTKSDHLPNAQESADLKAKQQMEERKAKVKDPDNPYAGF